MEDQTAPLAEPPETAMPRARVLSAPGSIPKQRNDGMSTSFLEVRKLSNELGLMAWWSQAKTQNASRCQCSMARLRHPMSHPGKG